MELKKDLKLAEARLTNGCNTGRITDNVGKSIPAKVDMNKDVEKRS